MTQELASLREQRDSEAFLPLRSEELAGSVGARFLHFCDLVDKLANGLVRRGITLGEPRRAAATRGAYSREIIIGPFLCTLLVGAQHWSDLRETPLWLSLPVTSGQQFAEARRRLSELEREDPSRLIEDGGWLLVPIFLPTGKDEDAVLRAAREQVDEVIALLIDKNGG
jgi:hypothetical protein